MNNAFKQNKILVLSENYLIKPDNANGVVLVHAIEKEVFNDNTLEDETKTVSNEWHFPRVAQALRKYADLELVFDDKIENLTEKTEKVYSLIDKIDQTFKQF